MFKELKHIILLKIRGKQRAEQHYPVSPTIRRSFSDTHHQHHSFTSSEMNDVVRSSVEEITKILKDQTKNDINVEVLHSQLEESHIYIKDLEKENLRLNEELLQIKNKLGMILTGTYE